MTLGQIWSSLVRGQVRSGWIKTVGILFLLAVVRLAALCVGLQGHVSLSGSPLGLVWKFESVVAVASVTTLDVGFLLVYRIPSRGPPLWM